MPCADAAACIMPSPPRRDVVATILDVVFAMLAATHCYACRCCCHIRLRQPPLRHYAFAFAAIHTKKTTVVVTTPLSDIDYAMLMMLLPRHFAAALLLRRAIR